MKEIKNGLIIFFTGVFLTLIIIGIVYVKNKFEKVEEVVRTTMFTGIQMPNPNDIKKRLRVQDIVIEDIQGSQNLIVMEVNLTEEVVWDESFTNLDIFKKAQKIRYHGVGNYTTDLALLTEKDISFDFDGNSIFVTVQRPVLNSLEIDETKTEIYNTDNGLLRFGEITFTIAQQNEILSVVKGNMRQKLNEPENLKQAEKEAEKSVEDLIKKFMIQAGYEDYEVKVFFKSI